MKGSFVKPRTAEEVERGFRDIQRLRATDVAADVMIINPRRLILQSPDGHYWSLSISNVGALTTNDLGLNAP